MDQLSLLCVHPHPDDESIACGGVLARYSAEGIRTHVVTCTGGEAGENLAGIDLGERSLAEHRHQEMADAIVALGVTGHTWLGYRDSGMAGTADNENPECFAQADLYEASARLARLIRELRPNVVVSDDEHGTYGHPDHVKAHRVTVRAVALAADPWWVTEDEPWSVAKQYVHVLSRDRIYRLHEKMLEMGLPSAFGDAALDGPADLPFGVDASLVTTSVTVADQIPVKQKAMAAHRSQIGEDSFFLNTPSEMFVDGFGVEEFLRIDDTATGRPDGEVEDDLFAGLR